MVLRQFGIALLLILFSVSPVRANSVTVSEISGELICQCGCTLILLNCNHDECMSRDTMTTIIQQKIDEGQSKEQIIQSFVDLYGESVLASPPKRGFNLVVWVLPFAAILFGGGIVYITIKAWVRRGEGLPTDAVTETGEENEKYQHRLEQELKEFTERGFR